MDIFHRVKKINLISISTDEPTEDVPCGTCGVCCEILAPHLTIDEINSGKYPISFVDEGLTGPTITLFRNSKGGCAMYIEGKCSIYEHRPTACRQFDCRKGHHLKTNNVAMEKFGVDVNETREDSRILYTEE